MKRRTLASLFIATCGGVALLPQTSEAQLLPKPPPQTIRNAPPAKTWETTWDAAWARATQYYAIQAATTVAGDAACQGDLGFNPRVKELARAIAAKKYGDATRLIGVIQDKSLCLTLEGARGLEYALAGWVHRAMTELAGADQEIAVHGALNVGTLVFDELQYTRRSWWMPALKYHADRLAPIVARYPRGELGFYAFDWSRGTLASGVDPVGLLASMRDFKNYGDGSCNLLDMAAASFQCKGWVGNKGMGGAGGAGGAGGSGGAAGGLPGGVSRGVGAGAMACMVDAARSSGQRGQLACAAKAVSGMTFDPKTTSPTSLLSSGTASSQPGVRDPSCARSSDAGNGGAQQDPEAKKKEPSPWDKVVDGAKAAAGYVKDVFMAMFDKTPPGVAELGQLASAEGADFARGVGQIGQANDARNALLSGNDDAIYEYNEKRDKRVTTDPQANNNRTVDNLNGPLGSRGGGGCSRGSNAARRANALYDCIVGGQPKPTNRGPNNPLIALTDPGQVQTTPTGAFACMMQGGDMPRAGFTDMKCANTRCVQGALSCPCDRSGGGNALTSGGIPTRITPGTSPNCAEPPCGQPLVPPKPVTTGGGTVGPLPGTLGGPGAPRGTSPSPVPTIMR